MKRIVVIGASSGMGRRVAIDFARVGWRVGIAARNEVGLRSVRDMFPDRVVYSVIDVTTPEAVRRLEELIDAIGGMDVLLYAAGTGWHDTELDPCKTEATIGVNVIGFTAMIDAAYKYFKNSANAGIGRIAAITSVAGTKGLGVSAAYSSTKRYQWTYLQALDQLAHAQRVNVSVTDIRPGFVDTPLLNGNKGYPMLMSVGQVAPRIEKAILAGRRVVTIDGRWNVVCRLWRLIPDALWRKLRISL